MRRLLLLLAVFAVPALALAQSQPIDREDAFILIWNSLHRPIEQTSEKQYSDIKTSDSAYDTIRYAKSRKILGDAESFRPTDPVKLNEALVWLFKTRNVDDPDAITADTLPTYLAKYPIAILPGKTAVMPTLTQDQLLFLMRSLDSDLVSEVHEVSLYSEEFNGQGTAFGETFNMYDMTAAHRTFPYNTLVKVTNVENGKSVIVRINDRGPYVKGRDMDLSLGAFTAIAPRSEGVIHATFQRLGDATLVGDCVAPATYQQVITKSTILHPGIPHILHLGDSVSIQSTSWFVVRSVEYPDGTVASIQNWVQPKGVYTFVPSIVGDYIFTLSSMNGHNRTMQMHVADCGGRSSSPSSSDQSSPDQSSSMSSVSSEETSMTQSSLLSVDSSSLPAISGSSASSVASVSSAGSQ